MNFFNSLSTLERFKHYPKMKRPALAFSLLFTLAVAAHAQQITATSSADDCVGMLHQAAQTRAGKSSKYNFTRAVSFTGGSFTETQQWPYFLIKNSFQNIDWSGFKNVSQHKTEEGEIYVYFNFNAKTITEERVEIDNQTSLVKEKETEEGDYFFIIIPASEESRVKDMEAAAKRLAQISLAKGNLFKQTPRASNIKTIEGKPSFQETVNYINTFLKDGAGNDLFCNTVRFYNRSALVGEHVNGGVYLKSSYLWEGSYTSGSPRRQENFNIDLSKVEEIRVVRGEGFQGGCCQFGLWFVEKGKDAVPQMHLPLWSWPNSTPNDRIKEEKIYKAFSHLRQLVGAPEPISF
jgi:hypothetical protein